MKITDFSFEKWIEMVENNEIQAPGLLAASLDFRVSLRLAFQAGRDAQRKEARL